MPKLDRPRDQCLLSGWNMLPPLASCLEVLSISLTRRVCSLFTTATSSIRARMWLETFTIANSQSKLVYCFGASTSHIDKAWLLFGGGGGISLIGSACLLLSGPLVDTTVGAVGRKPNVGNNASVATRSQCYQQHHH